MFLYIIEMNQRSNILFYIETAREYIIYAGNMGRLKDIRHANPYHIWREATPNQQGKMD